MRILHTADWHIGKKLHQYEMHEVFDLFIQWLISTIQEQNIDVLLIAGDVFDLANPSAEARKQYYNALIQLNQANCKIIITGGNHDSPNMLNAPRDILNVLDIHVIGGASEMKEQMIPLPDKDQVEIVVAAIPFLRDADLRKANEGESYEDRLKVVQMGIENTYHNAVEYGSLHYPHIPIIAMGHLYTAGATTSDSERDIQMGNQAMFHANRFGDDFDYIALGHIHKPQQVNHHTPTYYSGSPYPLSFSERNDEKRVLLIDTDKSFEPISIPVPHNQKLLRIKGDLASIRKALNNLPQPSRLTSLIEIHLDESVYNADHVQQLEDVIRDFDKPGYEIVHRTIAYHKQITGTSQIYDATQNLSELAPKEVFQKLLQEQEMEEAMHREVQNAFQIILEEVQQELMD